MVHIVGSSVARAAGVSRSGAGLTVVVEAPYSNVVRGFHREGTAGGLPTASAGGQSVHKEAPSASNHA